MKDLTELPDSATETASSKEEEHKFIEQLKQWADNSSHRVQQLLSTLDDLELSRKIRSVRALAGNYPPAESSLGDILVTRESRFLYYLLKGLKESLGDNAIERVKNFVTHDDPWVAGMAYDSLITCDSPPVDYITEQLRNEPRNPVKIKALRAMYKRGATEYKNLCEELVRTNNSTSQVKFFAAVVLKLVAPDRLGELAEDDQYVSRIESRVAVKNSPEGVADN